jgi:hypothetical protein
MSETSMLRYCGGILLLRPAAGERYKSKGAVRTSQDHNPASAIVGITADNGTMLNSQATVRVGDESAMSRTRPHGFRSFPSEASPSLALPPSVLSLLS